MDMFRHRPLFLWCTAYIAAAAGGFLLFFTILSVSPSAKSVLFLVLVGLTALGIGTGIVLWFRRHRRQAIMAGLATVLAIVGFLQSYVTFSGPQARRLSSLVDKPVTVCGIVTDRRGGSGSMSSFSLELWEVDGTKTSGKAVFTCYYDADLHAGDVVRVRATAVSLDDTVGDGYSATALLGDGYVVGLRSEAESDVTVTGERPQHIGIRMGNLCRTLSKRLQFAVGNGADGLPSALLLGDRSNVPDDVRRDFARSGVSHLLAISGLHMTLLFGLLAWLLRLCRVPRRISAILLCVTAWGYLILLGFPPSATRAVVMLGFVYVGSLLFVRSDPLTSLGTAGFLILLFSPYTVADAGFWLSYLSVFALLAVTPAISRFFENERLTRAVHPWIGKIKRGVMKGLSGLSVGVIAMSATLSVVAAVIGETSLLSPITTLLLTPLCGAILLLSLIALPLAYTPVGAVIGAVIAKICTWMTDITACCSARRLAVVSLTHPAVLPIAAIMVAGVLIFLSLRLPEGKRWLIVAPLLVGWISLAAVLGIAHHVEGDRMKISFLQPSEASDMLVMVKGRDAVICDFSNGSRTALTAATAEASRRGSTEIAVLMLTHYHRNTGSTLQEVFARERVRQLWVPYPESESDYYFLLDCAERAEHAQIPVVLYHTNEALYVFNGEELMLQTASLDRSAQPVLLLTLDTEPSSADRGKLIYCGSAVFESALADEAMAAVSTADVIVFGNHGPLIKETFGNDVTFRDGAQIIFSETGDIAACFQADNVPESAYLWFGQRRFCLP